MSKIEVELLEIMGSDRTIAEAAWTSSRSHAHLANRPDADVEKVVGMLVKEGHGTPLEHVVMRFWLKIPVYVSRQLVKHRAGVSWNEISGRYRTLPADWFSPDDLEDGKRYNDLCLLAQRYYMERMAALKADKELGLIDTVQYKRQREIVRGILPQSMMTEVTVTINLRALIHMAGLRCKPDAQRETAHTVQLMMDAAVASGRVPAALAALGY